MSPQEFAIRTTEDATRRAEADTLLTPRFYRTDYAALDRMNLEPVRAEWDALMAEFRRDNNRHHFERDEQFAAEVRELPDGLREEFIEFLVSSCTAEFSGCVLYSEIKKNVRNEDMRALMGYMARDESRHAGFINKALKDFGLGVDLGQLTKSKKYTYFKPKYIYYATYLSEKIGYARYITIFRQLERYPERRFHPIFRWFEEWCDDEFRHGEAFAVLMRANPHLLRGMNRYWIRFFLLAVYATMYVRDHQRPYMHQAFGIDPTDYDYKVFSITSACTKQVFPFTLDTESPKFRTLLERLRLKMEDVEAGKKRGGLIGTLQRGAAAIGVASLFVRLYFQPVIEHEVPADVRMAPAW
jgi:magnesium-protoporphyrin IX monomethyl ester (oxidative) cyclase